jgi:hypothetical protein
MLYLCNYSPYKLNRLIISYLQKGIALNLTYIKFIIIITLYKVLTF